MAKRKEVVADLTRVKNKISTREKVYNSLGVCTKAVEDILTAGGKRSMEHLVFEECLAGRTVSMEPYAILKMVRDYAKNVDATLAKFQIVLQEVQALQQNPDPVKKEEPESSCSRSGGSSESESEGRPEGRPDQGEEQEREAPRASKEGVISGRENGRPKPQPVVQHTFVLVVT